ncbi:putative baseplate assembly protein [Microcystis sp. LEGE 08355]|uniref:putative baseplate assembly protein n=1 Tax=Microcystis sp. LEGE 08355 TaxID=1828687 RepID=UPI00188230D5|nr:putative baseplate assembly protein [Microcystis sp. LEGE 08355]MBE9071033.1 putative baseplate assembly protein [Microcystis sp. LEGE 08355]
MGKNSELLHLAKATLIAQGDKTESWYHLNCYNPPGLTQLSYRAGTYSTFLLWMLAQAPKEIITNEQLFVTQPLANLNTNSLVPNDIALAFLKIWAVLGDILTFYNERIINEGYLSTSVESFSVEQLVRSLGYQPDPGLGATTYLAFTLRVAQGIPTEIIIPAGPQTRVQSLPKLNQKPVIFETSESIVARAAWNAIKIYQPTVYPQINLNYGATGIRVAGTATGLKPNSPLLLLRENSHQRSPQTVAEFRLLHEVEVNKSQGYTLALWQTPLTQGKTLSLTSDSLPQALTFKQQAKLFGHNAPFWNRLPERTKAQYSTRLGGIFVSDDRGQSWLSHNINLPDLKWQTLVITSDGTVFLGTNKGLYRNKNQGDHWEIITGGLSQQPIFSLLLTSDDQLFVGTVNGGVFRSVDGGESWDRLQGLLTIVETNPNRKLVNATLPRTSVRSIAWNNHDLSKPATLFVGTDNGIFRLTMGGRSWQPTNRGLPHYNEQTGQTSLIIYALAINPINGYLYAGTNLGIFASSDQGNCWRSLNKGLPNYQKQVASSSAKLPRLNNCLPSTETAITIKSIIHYQEPQSQICYLFVVTEAGIFRSQNNGHNWQLVNNGLESPNGKIVVSSLGTLQNQNQIILLAGTNQGLFSSDNHGNQWQLLDPVQNIEAVATNSKNKIAIATPLGEFKDQDWPNFYLPDNYIDLDKVYSSIILGSFVILRQQLPTPIVGIYRVKTVLNLVASDFTLKTSITRLEIDSHETPKLSQFNLRNTQVFLQTISLKLSASSSSPPTLVKGLEINLNGENLGLAKGQTLSITGKRPRAIIIGSLGGVYRNKDKKWDLLGLENFSVEFLSFNEDNNLVAATEIGIFIYKSNQWSRLGKNIIKATKILLSSSQELVSATEDGVYYYKPSTDEWSLLGNLKEPVLSLIFSPQGDLYCGTEKGVFYYHDSQWISLGFSDQKISALLWTPSYLYVGTNQEGVYRCTIPKLEEQAVIQGLNIWKIKSLVSDSQGQLFAGTDGGGIFYSSDQGITWKERNFGLSDQHIQCLLISPQDILYAGTERGGLFYSLNQGETWIFWPLGISNNIKTLTLDGENNLYVGTGTTAYLQSAESLEPTPLKQQQLFTIPSEFKELLNQGFITEQLNKIFQDNNQSLAPSTTIEVEQVDRCWRLSNNHGNTFLIRQNFRQLIVEYTPQFEVLKAPVSHPKYAHLYYWFLQSPDSLEIKLIAQSDEIICESAVNSSSSISEITVVADVINKNNNHTVVSLTKSLEFVYDDKTVTVCGNVARATQGETIRNEILGSGNSAQKNQKFALQRHPLIFLPNPNGIENLSTLTIAVERQSNFNFTNVNHTEIIWHQVSNLFNSTTDSHDYLLQVSEQGKATITFGDGKQGSRLPTGRENVLATYRTGIGQDGNVDRGQLSIMVNRQPGVDKVINPIPASGGRNPEKMVNIRQIAPLFVRTLGRIVSLNDYEDLAITFPGIAKAKAQVLWNGHQQLIHLTIAANDGVQISKNSKLCQDLYQEIQKLSIHSQPIQIDSFVPLFFQFQVKVIIAENSDILSIKSQIKETFNAQYCFQQQTFGQTITSDSIIATIQSITGVLAVDLEALCFHGDYPQIYPTLQAKLAEWNIALQEIVPAQLLLLVFQESFLQITKV